jgi:hypothetical protein
MGLVDESASLAGALEVEDGVGVRVADMGCGLEGESELALGGNIVTSRTMLQIETERRKNAGSRAEDVGK